MIKTFVRVCSGREIRAKKSSNEMVNWVVWAVALPVHACFCHTCMLIGELISLELCNWWIISSPFVFLLQLQIFSLQRQSLAYIMYLSIWLRNPLYCCYSVLTVEWRPLVHLYYTRWLCNYITIVFSCGFFFFFEIKTLYNFVLFIHLSVYLLIDICACRRTLYGTRGGEGGVVSALWHGHQAIIFLFFDLPSWHAWCSCCSI